METFIIPLLVMGAMAILFAVILNYASNVFFVPVDETVAKVRTALPGANCGACGYPGCDGFAAAIASGDAPINACPIGGQDTVVELAKIMGQDAVDMERMVAVVKCNGDKTRAKDKYEFQGKLDCRSMAMLQGGNKQCDYGCLGGGSCELVCEFGAIEIIDGLAVIDKDKCTACEKCVGICPKGIIEMMPYNRESVVLCSSHDKGKDVRGYCKVGCIGCSICAKQYPGGFEMDKLLATAVYDTDNVDQEALNNAISKCPNDCISPGKENIKVIEKEVETVES